MNTKCAFVTVLSTNNYHKGVIALFESIKQTDTKYNSFIVIVNETIYDYIIDDYIKRGYTVIKKTHIRADSINNTSHKHWENTFDKFHIFDLDEYDKIVYLDSDIFVVKNIDQLFELPHMSAVIAGKSAIKEWNEINSGLMVIEPKRGTSNELIKTLQTTPFDKDIGDQYIIEKHYDWKNKGLAISENYNIFDSFLNYYVDNLNYDVNDIAVIHFIGSKKPWMLNKKEREKHIESIKGTHLADYYIKYLSITDKIGKS